MSSALSMLKKTRRPPLQSHLSPDQHVPVSPCRDTPRDAPRRDLLEDSNLTHSSHTPARGASTSKSKAPLKKGAAPSDFELMSAMMQRMTLLEAKVMSQEQEIKSKNKKISVLEERLKTQQESGSVHDLGNRVDLEKRCQQLRNQVHEMESFLNDYGLIWVGDRETSDSAESELTNSSIAVLHPGTSGFRDFHMNFDLVLQRIMELNILAGEGESFVQSTSTGAQLAQKAPIQLRLYRNGIVMFDGPFRSYQEHSTQQCMQDLMDGYFPAELQERFPDGVPFEVHDRRDEEFIFRLPWEKSKSRAATSQIPDKKLSTDQFLRKLPKVVVKAGRVIDIRNSLRANLQGSSNVPSSDSMIFIDTAALQEMRARLDMFRLDQPSSAHDVITLKVKSEDGSQTYILKMCFSETIGHLRQYLDKHRGGGLPGYDIISAYPQSCYNDNYKTLQSCGLTTNATLLLRKRQHCPSLIGVK